jgi:hypothetical protein
MSNVNDITKGYINVQGGLQSAENWLLGVIPQKGRSSGRSNGTSLHCREVTPRFVSGRGTVPLWQMETQDVFMESMRCLFKTSDGQF